MTGLQSTALDDLLQDFYCLLGVRHPELAYKFGRPYWTTDTELACLTLA